MATKQLKRMFVIQLSKDKRAGVARYQNITTSEVNIA